ncbi:MAG TPA: hypothetical protein VLF18_01890 [Tahibacter sp.]|uniref:hypothetical protein n=1 Tax=Tahibacter sp. TaxID=2056211 RepID=UPI002C8C0CFE|nr:hypothetical protein [Tahibacter sp.]HSX58927.1 hypothetical protein [Tahibacter sp.]
MNGITALHVAGGAIALAAGSVAILVRKGRGMHAAAGTGFCLAMFVLGLTASLLAPLKSPPESPVGGIVVCYFVATAWMAARRRSGAPGPIENVACAFAVAIGAAIIGRGFALAFAPPGQFAGPPGPGALFALGGVCLFAGLLDLRWILRRTQSATQRISRHLWRMCFAFFMATGSFFSDSRTCCRPRCAARRCCSYSRSRRSPRCCSGCCACATRALHRAPAAPLCLSRNDHGPVSRFSFRPAAP